MVLAYGLGLFDFFVFGEPDVGSVEDLGLHVVSSGSWIDVADLLLSVLHAWEVDRFHVFLLGRRLLGREESRVDVPYPYS